MSKPADEKPMRIIGIDANLPDPHPDFILLSALREDGQIAQFHVDLGNAEPLRQLLECSINRLIVTQAAMGGSGAPMLTFQPSADLVSFRALIADTGEVVVRLSVRERDSSPAMPPPTIAAFASLEMAEHARDALDMAITALRIQPGRTH